MTFCNSIAQQEAFQMVQRFGIKKSNSRINNSIEIFSKLVEENIHDVAYIHRLNYLQKLLIEIQNLTA